jgi:formate dehydrogenase subunit delta
MASEHHAIDPGEKLGRMANQIAGFFRTYPEDEAIAGVHDHIVSFWSPSMRRDLTTRAERSPDGLDPLVLRALHAIRTGKSPASREAAGPREVGEIGASDAG